EGQSDVANLAVKLQQGVLPERRCHRFEAGHERGLKPHHREPDEPERDREVRPEPMAGLVRADGREYERCYHHAEVCRHADHGPDRECHDCPSPRWQAEAKRTDSRPRSLRLGGTTSVSTRCTKARREFPRCRTSWAKMFAL